MRGTIFRRRAEIMAGVLARLSAQAVRGAFAVRLHSFVKAARGGLLLLALFGASAAARAEPAVPPGQHPGGMPIALVGAGIDYTAPDIHARLARDGEGELTGYDFIDDDRKPYATPGDTAAARVLMREAPDASLVLVRTEFSRAEIFERSLAFVLKCPARVVVLFDGFSEPGLAALVEMAALHFPKHLIIVEAGSDGLDLDLMQPALPRDMSNVLVVTAAAPDGQVAGNRGKATVDLAVAAPNDTAETDQGGLAAARTAALAARLLRTAPDISGKDLKQRLIEIARPLPADRAGLTRNGWIAAAEQALPAE